MKIKRFNMRDKAELPVNQQTMSDEYYDMELVGKESPQIKVNGKPGKVSCPEFMIPIGNVAWWIPAPESKKTA